MVDTLTAEAKALVKYNKHGSAETEEYNLVMFHLLAMGHSVSFLTRAKLLRLLSAGPSAWKEHFGGVDALIDGDWPYDDPSAEHAMFRHSLDDLQHLTGLRVIPAPQDVLFAAHKARYHAFLSRCPSFGAPVVIPSVYLRGGSSLREATEAVAQLQALVEADGLGPWSFKQGLALKRGLAENGQHGYLLLDSEASAKHVWERLRDEGHGSEAATLWLLQPYLPEFETGAELKLYFLPDGDFLTGFAQKWYQGPSRFEPLGELQELRRDSTLWVERRVEEALSLARVVQREIVRCAPSLALLLRFDIIHTDRASWSTRLNTLATPGC